MVLSGTLILMDKTAAITTTHLAADGPTEGTWQSSDSASVVAFNMSAWISAMSVIS
jgi:hypothetical protein